jgi:hypothetical protein
MPARRTLLTAALAATAQPAAAQTLVQSLNSLAARANAGTIGIVTGGIDGTYVRIAADLAVVLDDGDALRILTILGRGSLQNISDILVLRGVDVGHRPVGRPRLCPPPAPAPGPRLADPVRRQAL